MAFDAFLKIEGIDGESTDATHKGEIEIESYSWGVSNTGSVVGGGGGTGKAVVQDFQFGMPVSKASPQLMLACATGRHFQQATLTCRKAGGSRFEFLKIKLSDLLVSSYEPSANKGGESPDAFPTETIKLAFVKIDFLYSVERTGETVETAFSQESPS